MSSRPLVRAIPLALLLAAGCDPEPTRAPPRKNDKQSLYGDATLLPSRAGEAARAELATSGEVERMLEAHPQVESAVASLSDGSLVVVAVAGEDARAPELRTLIEPLVGPETQITLQLETKEAPPKSRRGLPVVLGIALLGLGVSAGVWVERFRSTQGGRAATAARRRR